MTTTFFTKAAVFATLFAASAGAQNAISNIEINSTVSAGSPTQVSFTGADTREYNVYLAAAIIGENGPTCYLATNTTLTSPLTLRVPPSVGPEADYYSIAITLTDSRNLAYSPQFTLTNTTGVPSDYEKALNGAPFWSPESLPCESYQCARECAQRYYPEDLTEPSAYRQMRDCILECKGVAQVDEETGPTGPALASGTATVVEGPSATEAVPSETSSDAAGRLGVAGIGAGLVGGVVAVLL